MAKNTKPFVNVAMKGSGYYSAATKGAKDVIDGATPLVLNAIRKMLDADDSRPFFIQHKPRRSVGATSRHALW